jgi:hypothetical protein
VIQANMVVVKLLTCLYVNNEEWIIVTLVQLILPLIFYIGV